MCGAGAVYLEDCPIQRYISIYLIVGGVFALWEALSCMVESICQVKDPEGDSTFNWFCHVSESIIGCFTIAWFIAGE